MNKSEINKSLISLAEAVDRLFGIKLAEHKVIKDSLNSLVRNKTIPSIKEQRSHAVGGRSRIWIDPGHLDLIHNAVVLQGLFHDTRIIAKLLAPNGQSAYRRQMADLADAVLVGNRSVLGISLLSQETLQFVKMLRDQQDLTKCRLPNPFEILPQIVIGSEIGVMSSLVSQNSVRPEANSMMTHFLAGELEQAWELAKHIKTKDLILNRYIALVDQAYREAAEFDELLDALK